MTEDLAKRVAAYKAVDNHVKNGHIVGIGSGTTIKHAIRRIKQNQLDVKCIAISLEVSYLTLNTRIF
ncbi:unnamed protein product [Oppiella nova]|uniref:ribose-5-phosphate isomerase n=1 Tax=Oppiella nova TaxID=334625 RepID=A0A7R9QYS8_9ACAR|nr:unnamed protein product [Oppiella nova]CAG2180552.1 unnamed protein product [Oppiella nova]